MQGVAGTWKDLTDNVNSMASNLTGQVRNIAEVTTAVARGDLSKKITVDVKGEILELKNTINTMVDQLDVVRRRRSRASRARSAPRASSAARPRCKGVAGTWKDLTDNVNSHGRRTSPGRCATSPRSRPRSRTATCRRRSPVDVKGEILELKNTINTMVDQLALVRVGGDARRARGRHRGQARRPGRGARASPARGRT